MTTQDLARKVRGTGMGGMLAVLLEAAGPLTVIGAQVAYVAEPLIGGSDMRALGRMLEDPQKVRAFIDELRSSPEGQGD